MLDETSKKQVERESTASDRSGILSMHRTTLTNDGFGGLDGGNPRAPTVQPVSNMHEVGHGGRVPGAASRAYKPTAAEEISLKQAQSGAEAGEYWLIKKEGEKPWPGIICDEEMVQEFFKHRPLNARKAGGAWGKHFKPRGKLTGQRSFPAIYLDSLKCAWIPWHRLQPLDIGMAVSKMHEDSDPALRKAYEEVVHNRDLQYWKSTLLAQRLQEEEDATKAKLRKHGLGRKVSEQIKRQRKSYGEGAVFKDPPGWSPNNNEDDDESDLMLSPVKREVTANGSSEVSSGCYDNSDTEDFGQGTERPPRTNPDAKNSRMFATTSSTRASSSSENTPIGQDKVKIYVGDPHHIFVVKRCGMQQSALLSELQKHQSGEWFLMCPLLLRTNPSDFKPIAEYLDHGEYRPNLLDEHTDSVRLENVNTEEERSRVVLQCGVLYGLAEHLALPKLQDLALRKLKALRSYPASEILSITNLMYRDGRPATTDVHEFIVDYIAEHYYLIWESESEKLLETLKDNDDLAKGVHARLSGLLEEEDVIVKGEGTNKKDEGLFVDTS